MLIFNQVEAGACSAWFRGKSQVLLHKVSSKDQHHGRLLGAGEKCSISGPTPGPLSQYLNFQRNPRWFTGNSLSFIFPIFKMGIIKPIWHIYLGLNKIISVQRLGLKHFVLSYFILSGAWLGWTSPAFGSELESEKGLLVHHLSRYRGGPQGPSGVDDLVLTCPSLGALEGRA